MAKKKKKKRKRVGLWLIVGFGGLAAIMVAMVSSNTPSTPSEPVASTPPPLASPKPRTGNIANDRLLAMTEAEQARYLGVAVEDNCVGDRAFYMGWNHADQSAYWSVRCTDGHEYAVSIESDSVGSTQVLDCSMLKVVAKVNCFQTLKEQL